ncbi:hypothetical protein KFK09_023100 [Dendrobium nobile]|uniref:Uncharacterized protein n=1 Tax=Dendrobium nobile TaxID=94219 RepID=A0A8T3AJN4_DENNO|nr:hypothetical protein KFK09_023100 [Dendrobium nobile]
MGCDPQHQSRLLDEFSASELLPIAVALLADLTDWLRFAHRQCLVRTPLWICCLCAWRHPVSMGYQGKVYCIGIRFMQPQAMVTLSLF